MRKLLPGCLLMFFLTPISALSQQRLHLTLFGGISNYQGDMQDKQFTLDQARGAIGVGLKYDITPHLAVRTGLNYGTIQGSDKNSVDSALRARNLSFNSRILEGNLMLEYTFFDLEKKRISPFVFAGIAIFHFNPYAFDSTGNKVFLKPLSTEGQGLAQYPDRKPYHLTQAAIPFGGGIKFRIN